MLNKIVLMGRLTRDPEIRQTQSGVDVASFTLACDRDFADGTGQRQADFIDCVAWRQTAIFAHKYFSKGRMAVVSGRLQIRPWETNNGEKRRSSEIVVDNIYFGDSKRDGENGSQGSYREQEPPRSSYGGSSQENYGSWGQSQGRNQGDYGTRESYGGGNAQGSYPTSDYGGGFADLDDDDGDLPF